MSSKTSCFKTVIKSDIKRLWWISAIAAAFMMLVPALLLFLGCQEYLEHGIAMSGGTD